MTMDTQAAVAAAEAAARGPLGGVLERLATRVGLRASADAVFGAPVEREGVTVIPVAKVRWGFGGGGGTGVTTEDGTPRTSQGEGGGGGVMAGPLGYIEIRDGRAEFRPIFDPASYARLVIAGGLAAWLVFRGFRSVFR